MPPEPARPAPPELDIAIRNLERGQIIEVDVRGAWSEADLDRRLARLVSVRQPSALHVCLDGGPHRHEPPPQLVAARAALDAIGGRIAVTVAPPPSEGPRRPPTAAA